MADLTPQQGIVKCAIYFSSCALVSSYAMNGKVVVQSK